MQIKFILRGHKPIIILFYTLCSKNWASSRILYSVPPHFVCLKVLPMYELVSLKWMVLHPLHIFCLQWSAAGCLDNCHNLNFGKLQKPIQREASSPSSHASKYQEQDFLNSPHIYVQSWVKCKCQRKVANSLFCSISAIVQTQTSPSLTGVEWRVVRSSCQFYLHQYYTLICDTNLSVINSRVYSSYFLLFELKYKN